MRDFAEVVREELTATAPPRKIGIRSFSKSWLFWYKCILIALGFLLFGYGAFRTTVNYLIIGNGVHTIAQVTGHFMSTKRRSGGKLGYYFYASFKDPEGKEVSSCVEVDRQTFESQSEGSSVVVFYLPGFPQWAYSESCPPGLENIYSAIGFGILTLFELLTLIYLLRVEYLIFKNGVFVQGFVAGNPDDIKNYSTIKIEYVFEGKLYEKTVRIRYPIIYPSGKEIAVVVLNGNPKKAQFYFSKNTWTVFKAKLPKSYQSQLIG